MIQTNGKGVATEVGRRKGREVVVCLGRVDVDALIKDLACGADMYDYFASALLIFFCFDVYILAIACFIF